MSVKLTASNPALEQAFRALKSRDDVAKILDVKPAELRFYLYKAKNYKTFEIQKRSGGKRLIHSPDTALKIIQRKLNQVLHAVYKGRSPVHGFAKGRSIRTNASRHLNCHVLLNFDLADFFPTINFGRVKGLFESKPHYLPYAVSVVLAQICCHNKALPAGAPTSPTVANMICAQMDSHLRKLAARHNCTYTLYADDITISNRDEKLDKSIAVHDDIAKKWFVGDEVEKIVKNNGFTINASKTRVRSRHGRQQVTGLIVNERLNVKRRFVRQVRAMLHAWKQWGEAAAAAEFQATYDRKQRAQKKPDFKRVVRGKLEFIGFVKGRDDAIFLSLIERYAKLDSDAKIRPVTATTRATDNILFRHFGFWRGMEVTGIMVRPPRLP